MSPRNRTQIGPATAKVLEHSLLATTLLCVCSGICLALGDLVRAALLAALTAAVGYLAWPEMRKQVLRLFGRRTLARPLSSKFESRMEQLHRKPPIHVCDDFLSMAECDALIAAAEPHLVASTAGGNLQSSGRTSLSCMLARTRPECQSLLDRCSELTGHPIEHLEDPQVARYRPGEFYEPHLDAPDKSDGDGKGFLRCGGARIATVLIYLNDVRTGGATRFTRLRTPASRLVVQPARGKMLLFFPSNAKGRVDVRLEHEARPPAEGETKWVAQVWLRQRPDPTKTFIDNPNSVIT